MHWEELGREEKDSVVLLLLLSLGQKEKKSHNCHCQMILHPGGSSSSLALARSGFRLHAYSHCSQSLPSASAALGKCLSHLCLGQDLSGPKQ